MPGRRLPRQNAGMAEFLLQVNGQRRRVQGEPDDSLLWILREELHLTGSKYGCGEGFCGACSVMIDGRVTRSCVTAVSGAVGKAITTIEGVADGDRLHPVQEAFLEHDAFQCGYCTPGMVMAVIGLLAATPDPTDEDIARVLDRNVCRCGTYPRIVAAVKQAAANTRSRR